MGRPRFVAGEATRVPWAGIEGEICHEYDGWGNHRITHKGALGRWAEWGEPATYMIGDRLFRAYTDHFRWINEIEEIIAVLPRTFSNAHGYF